MFPSIRASVPPFGDIILPIGDTLPPIGEVLSVIRDIIPPTGDTVPSVGDTVLPIRDTFSPVRDIVPLIGDGFPPAGAADRPTGANAPLLGGMLFLRPIAADLSHSKLFSTNKNSTKMSLIADSDLAFVAQLNNMKAKIGGYATTLGLSPVQVAAIVADADYMSFMVLGLINAKEYTKAWTSRKDETRYGTGLSLGAYPVPVDITTPPPVVPPGVEKRYSNLIASIKANAAYTNAMGEDLGIIAADSGSEITAPELKLKRDGANVVVGFKRGGKDGVRIYSKRGSEAAFAFLAHDSSSPYVDNRPNLVPGTPEKREYYAMLFDDSNEVGDPSATVSIIL